MQTNPIHNTEWPERFAVLVFGGLQLLIPQSDIYSLEPVLDMAPCFDIIGSVGHLKQGGKMWSLYALSSDLDLLDSCPDSYRIAILMKNVKSEYGLLCEQVDSIARDQINIYPIPAVMYCKDAPLLALALHGEEVCYISSASELSRLFSH